MPSRAGRERGPSVEIEDDAVLDEPSGPYVFELEGEREAGIGRRVGRDSPAPPRGSALRAARALLALLRTCTCEGAERLEGVPLWWMAVRPCVLPTTAVAVLIGILLAATAGPFGAVEAGISTLVLVGAIAAHAGNNLLNDWIDVRHGSDRAGDFRSLYAPHVILSGQLTPGRVLAGAAVLHLLGLAILVVLVALVGPGIAWFALAGLALSLAYVAPPFSLNKRGLGEAAAAAVWGPVMIGGAFYALRGEVPVWAWLSTVPYGLLVAAILVGKHLDKLDLDEGLGVRTLPVRIGAERARDLTVALAQVFLVSVALLVVAGAAGPWVLLVLLALPRFRALSVAYAEARPEEPPEGHPLWPLWYVTFAMSFTRAAGALLVVGLALNLALAKQPA
jgi:1,4-dihydroxy-2-naphthoate polyprenyltransferase